MVDTPTTGCDTHSAELPTAAEPFAAYTALPMDFCEVAQSVNAEGYISFELMYCDATRVKCTSLLGKEPFKSICNKPQPRKHPENRACVFHTTASRTAAFQPQSKPAATTPHSVKQHGQWQSFTTLEQHCLFSKVEGYLLKTRSSQGLISCPRLCLCANIAPVTKCQQIYK